MYIKAKKELSSYFVDIIKEELNVKNAEFKEDVSKFSSYTFKPQLKTVGPKYGKQLGGIKEYLSNVDGNAAMADLKANGAIKFEVNGTEISLAEEDLLIDIAQMDGFVTDGDNYVTVVLDITLTPELIEEGFVREIISKVQTMRKDAGFDVTDKIRLYVEGNDKIADIINNNEDAIKKVVLANEFNFGKTDGYVKDWNINGEKVNFGVEVMK